MLSPLADDAVKLAGEILDRSRRRETSTEKKRSAMMARMMSDAAGKKFTIAMADEVLRVVGDRRAANRLVSLVDHYGVPKYFSLPDRLATRIGYWLARWIPGVIMPAVAAKIRRDSEHVIISADESKFANYLSHRKQSQLRINLSQLGEAVLGEAEAQRRLEDNLRRLREPGVDYISVKLSAIASQISLTGYQQTLDSLKPRLRELYRAAIAGGETSGTQPASPKFVNLDMEEYRDLRLTLDVFQSVLDEPEFESLMAGVVLQAYLPDSFESLKSLTQWAQQRHQRSGGRIKVRIVKGANLAMEQVEASLHHWPQAPYATKLESDANFKRMIEFATRPENASFVQVGVGSHNLFDIALALVLRETRGVENFVEFEMLEGMSNAQAAEVKDQSGGVLLYAPVVNESEFEAAIAYLVRRLDENTAPESFLGALFALEQGSAQWTAQVDAFRQAIELAASDRLASQPSRQQNRMTEQSLAVAADARFQNAADTDFSLPQNRQWVRQILDAWTSKPIEPIPVCVGEQQLLEPLTGTGVDPSQANKEVYQFAQATAEQVESALQIAANAQPDWEARGLTARSDLLRQCGAKIAAGRADAIGSMLVDAGKSIQEADVEVSEAIDFANYYANSLAGEGWQDGVEHRANGVVVVTPPWNFPFAIPCGSILAALMAGNAVILKPATESVLVAWTLANQLWDAGIPRDVLQFLPMEDGPVGQAMISDSRVANVVLTGAFETAQLFRSWRSDLKLLAETSGKNCMIITSAADLDLAIKDLVKGAFGHAGQKCSATSIALIERSVYDSQKFRQQLVDAASSLKVGPANDPAAIVTPIIRPPGEALLRGLTQLDDGEQWLLKPEMIEGNPCLWSPGIRLGVRPGSWYHQTECFGPVLGLISVENLEQAIQIQNSSAFGLTGGLHSLDQEEIERWRQTVEVGNAYINRSTTGAIVQRQPFGGWKDSCIGPGAKAGGPNYVQQFCQWKTVAPPQLQTELPPAMTDWLSQACQSLGFSSDSDEYQTVWAAAKSYQHWWEHEFSRSHDPSQIHGETNQFRYRVRPWHTVRVESGQNPNCRSREVELLMIATACRVAGCPVTVSAREDDTIAQLQLEGVDIATETDTVWDEKLKQQKGGSVSLLGEIRDRSQVAANASNIPIFNQPVFANGRIELLKYFREQSVSQTVHRYGNIV